MSSSFRVTSLEIVTPTAARTYDFDRPLTVIRGPVGTGKSTLLMLLKHATGGNATLTPAALENVRRVSMKVRAGDENLTLVRAVNTDASFVEVYDVSEPDLPVRYTVAGQPGVPTVSSLLLEKLGIPALRIPTTRTGRNAGTVALTFQTVLSYIYLQAREIDQSIAGHTNEYKNRQRRAFFEIAFDLTSEEIIELEKTRNTLKEQERTATKRLEDVRSFLAESGRADVEQLKRERLLILNDLAAAQDRLGLLRADVATQVDSDATQRDAIDRTSRDVERARSARMVGLRSVESRQATLSQLRLDESRVSRTASAARTLTGFEFVVCPRCAQPIEAREVPTGHCTLCTQEEQVLPDAEEYERRLSRLRDQIDETSQLLEADLILLEEAEAGLDQAESQFQEAQVRYEQNSRSIVSARFAAISAAAGDVARLEEQVASIDRDEQLWLQLRQLRVDLSALRGQLRDVGLALQAARGAHQARREALNELSESFAEELDLLNVPLDGRGTIDATDYLPRIGGNKFDNLQGSGGGLTTAVHVAYSITLLRYALTHSYILLPTTLIIDSPRKGIGTVEAGDSELAVAIYRRLIALAGSSEHAGRLQIIIADNDVPREVSGQVYEIALTRENRSIPGVAPADSTAAELRVEDIDPPTARE